MSSYRGTRRPPGGTAGSAPSDAWRAFAGTPAGKLMRSMYATPQQSSAQHVTSAEPYRVQDWQAPDKGWRALGNDVEARDASVPTFDRAAAAGVQVPAVGRGPVYQRPAAVDMIARRRSRAGIARAEAAAAARGDVAQEPLRKAVSTEANKRRLQAINTYGGGNALPGGLTAEPIIKGPLPMHLLTGTSAGKRGQKERDAAAASGPVSRELKEMQDMFMDLLREVSHLRKAARTEPDADKAAAYTAQVADMMGDMKQLEQLIADEKSRLAEIGAL